MILDISDKKFRHIFEDERFHLPIRWDGRDFKSTLQELFEDYQDAVEREFRTEDLDELWQVCDKLIWAVHCYLNGFPAYAYYCMREVMEILVETPLKLSYATECQRLKGRLLGEYEEETPPLFRVTTVPDNKPYSRERTFHTPYDMRSKVSTNRYSIAGFPSLYLGTSLELCCEEIHFDPHRSFGLAGLFELAQPIPQMAPEIELLELSVKPQDFFEPPNRRDNELLGREDEQGRSSRRNHDGAGWLKKRAVRNAYVLWYPLIAACSYIRVNKADPFAAEYIIPQLLLQWVRSEMRGNKNDNNGGKENKLVGIRYFSCASVRASNMGLNYVFPTSGEWEPGKGPYCPVLAKAFLVSKPVYIHEFDSIADCEAYLKTVTDLKHIDA